MISSLNLLASGRGPSAASSPACGEGERFGARDFHPLETVVRLGLLFHLGLDFREILGRDAVRQVDVVIEAVLDRRAGGELRFRPKSQDGGGENVRGGMADPLQFRHWRTLVGRRSVGGGDVFGG